MILSDQMIRSILPPLFFNCLLRWMNFLCEFLRRLKVLENEFKQGKTVMCYVININCYNFLFFSFFFVSFFALFSDRAYFFSCLTWCRVDVALFVIWELVILAFLVFSAVSLYFRHLRLAFILVCVTLLLLLCMKITKQVRLARKKKRRMLLPLSM